MTKALLSHAFIGAALALFGQVREAMPEDSVSRELRKQSIIYNTAMAFNDPAVAKIALYNLITEDPGNHKLYDSLALIYYRYNQNVSAALVAQQAVRLNPDDQFATEIAATALEQIGALDKALTYYEKLYLSNSNLNILYKMSFLQMELERFAEADTSADIIIGDPAAKEITIVFPAIDNAEQEASLDIAAHRIKAMIEEATGNTDLAKAKYLEVLQMKPGLQVVQQQLRDLTKVKKEE